MNYLLYIFYIFIVAHSVLSDDLKMAAVCKASDSLPPQLNISGDTVDDPVYEEMTAL